MKLPSTAAAVQTDGSFDSSDFQIDVNQHAFNILSSGLYSDKYLAIVRELCCNAWDAHVAAGTTDKQFELFLPNSLSPVFKIRDYGTGLSEQEILDVYRVYFRSTKQQSNEMIGCFGLGSKTPYAYTQKFTVISYHNGTKYHFSAIIGDTGLPRLVKMAEMETSEPNGMEISFSVDQGDFWSFRNAAEKALRPFTLKPIVKGVHKFEPLTYDNPILSGKGWSVLRNEATKLAVMGNVEYPVSEQRGFSPNAKYILGLGIVFDMPLGSFHMTPSRESIKWSDFSIRNINDRLEEIYDEACKTLSTQISAATTLWDARVLANSLVHSTALRKLRVSVDWRGQALSSEIPIRDIKGLRVQKITATVKKRLTGLGNHSASFNMVDTILARDTKFYLGDFPGADSRVGNLVRDKFDSQQYCYLIKAETPEALQEFTQLLGLDSSAICLASSVPKRDHGGGGGHTSSLSGVREKVFKLVPSSASVRDEYWQPTEVDFDESDLGVYVEINRWAPVNTYVASYDHPKQLVSLMSSLSKLGADIPDGGLIGVKTAYVGKMNRHPNWVHIDSFVREQLFKVWESSDRFRVAYEFFHPDNEHDYHKVVMIRDFVEKAKKKNLLKSDSFLVKFYDVFSPYFSLKAQAYSFHTLAEQYMHRSVGEEHHPMSLVLPHRKKGTSYAQRVWDKYPLLHILLSANDSAFAAQPYTRYSSLDALKYKTICSYIKEIDESTVKTPS